MTEKISDLYIAIIEPANFDIRKQEVFFKEFGFVIGSLSSYMRDSLAKLCNQCHQIRKKGFSSEQLSRARKVFKRYSKLSLIKDEEFLVELVAALFDVAYFTANSNKNPGHIRKFTIIEGTQPFYFLYMGSKDHEIFELVRLFKTRFNASKKNPKAGTFIEFRQKSN